MLGGSEMSGFRAATGQSCHSCTLKYVGRLALCITEITGLKFQSQKPTLFA
jgi:hypothetical protein